MKERIEEIIEKFGGRLAGSREEDQAQDFFRKSLDEFCDRTEKQGFTAALTAAHDSLRFFCFLYLVGLLLYLVSLPLAFAVASVNAVLILGHVISYRYWLDRLYPQKESSNVIGVIEPREAARSTLIFSGHMDSTTEYQWWYWLKEAGFALTITAVVLMLLLPVWYGMELVLNSWSWHPFFLDWYWDIFLGLTPSIATLWWMRSDRVVPGAQDNLSGVVVAAETGRTLSGRADGEGEPLLKNTRVVVASFGSEEAGLRGARAFARANREWLTKENAVLVNLDGIMHLDDLQIVNREVFPMVAYPKDLVQKMQRAFAACGQKPRTGPIPVGATDGAAFGLEGLPAIALLGLGTKGLDPTYHTRLDLPEFVEEAALEKTRDILVAFAKKWDTDLNR